MQFEEFAAGHRHLYHVAWSGAVESIRAHGLLSTRALAEHFGATEKLLERLDRHRRNLPITLRDPKHGAAVIRDHRPLAEKKLAGLLDDGLTPADWYRILNRYVFLWATAERARSMVRAYPNVEQIVLVIAAEAVRERWAEVRLTRINTGATRATTRRGLASIVPAIEFPVSDARKIAEICIPDRLLAVGPHIVATAL